MSVCNDKDGNEYNNIVNNNFLFIFLLFLTCETMFEKSIFNTSDMTEIGENGINLSGGQVSSLTLHDRFQ